MPTVADSFHVIRSLLWTIQQPGLTVPSTPVPAPDRKLTYAETGSSSPHSFPMGWEVARFAHAAVSHGAPSCWVPGYGKAAFDEPFGRFILSPPDGPPASSPTTPPVSHLSPMSPSFVRGAIKPLCSIVYRDVVGMQVREAGLASMAPLALPGSAFVRRRYGHAPRCPTPQGRP